MNAHPVIVRACAGEPLARVALGAQRGLIIVANPESLRAVQAGESFPVRFPAEDVFAHDEHAFSALRYEWEQGRPTDALWAALHRAEYEQVAYD